MFKRLAVRLVELAAGFITSLPFTRRTTQLLDFLTLLRDSHMLRP